MSIELRLSEVYPPLPDPPRTIYRDVLNLPDPVKLGITIRYFNFDDIGLYFQITGQASGYTFGTVNLGLLGSGANKYRNLDEFGSRSKPSAGQFTEGEFDEDVKLILKAYTDAGYTELKWTHERTVGVHWIKSDDGAWTQDVSNNFDDGTVQGWSAKDLVQTVMSFDLDVATDYVLSAPYSLKLITHVSTDTYLYQKNLYVSKNGAILVYLGRPSDTVLEDYVPLGKWMRIVVPLPKNTTLELRIALSSMVSAFSKTYCIYKSFLTANRDKVFAIMDCRISKHADGYYQYSDFWVDDFKIISKA